MVSIAYNNSDHQHNWQDVTLKMNTVTLVVKSSDLPNWWIMRFAIRSGMLKVGFFLEAAPRNETIHDMKC